MAISTQWGGTVTVIQVEIGKTVRAVFTDSFAQR